MAQKINELIDSYGREKFFQILALFPLFFNWLFVFSRKGISENQKRSCLYGGLFSFYFFALLLFSFILSMLPVVGSYAGNIVHLVAIVFYLGISGNFIYALHVGKKVEISFVEKSIRKLNEILQ